MGRREVGGEGEIEDGEEERLEEAGEVEDEGREIKQLREEIKIEPRAGDVDKSSGREKWRVGEGEEGRQRKNSLSKNNTPRVENCMRVKIINCYGMWLILRLEAGMKISDISVDISLIYPISMMFDTISAMTDMSLIYRF